MVEDLENSIKLAIKEALTSKSEVFVVFDQSSKTFRVTPTRGNSMDFYAVFPAGEFVRYRYNSTLGEFETI